MISHEAKIIPSGLRSARHPKPRTHGLALQVTMWLRWNPNVLLQYRSRAEYIFELGCQRRNNRNKRLRIDIRYTVSGSCLTQLGLFA